MRKSFFIVAVILISSIGINSKENRNILLLYDKLNKKSELSILYLKEQLISEGILVKDIRIKNAIRNDLEINNFNYIVIYSEVRAFHMRKHLKKWLNTIDDFENKKIALFITSITEKYGKRVTSKIEDITIKKNGIILDAVSSATGKISEKNKKKRIETFSRKFIFQITK